MPYSEGGEILVALPDEQAFQGYWHNEEATAKKYVRDVFKKGDLYYRTGDALRRTDDGHWHFLDRLGDTFRWKSENVSTAEVAVTLGDFTGVQEANVYGVLVPGHEGRAGCAALLIDPAQRASFDFAGLLRYARERLPRYAVPVFIRLVEASDHIHNHKQNKVPLREEGIDPTKTGTKVASGKDNKFLWVRPGTDTYSDFGWDDWETLVKGQIKL
jgi:acyl-CoA synthetase (AMP-forming)/AMP-acid ligase II